MVATWSNSNPSSSNRESEVEVKVNLCLMVKNDEVCNDKLDDYNNLQNEYECLFNDFDKLRHRCKDFKKIIATLTLDLKNAKHKCEVADDNKNELQKGYDNAKSEN